MSTTEAVAVPDELREGLDERWVGCRKIRIEQHVKGNQWTSEGLAPIELKCEPNGTPEEEIDDIAEEVMRRVAKHFKRLGVDAQWYRFVCFCRRAESRKNGGRVKEQRLGFKLLYEGDEGVTDAESTDSPESTQVALEELRNENVAQMKDLIDDLHRHLQESHKVIVQQGSQIKLIAEPIAQAVSLAQSMWVTGVGLQQEAMRRQFDEKRLQAEKEEANRRLDAVMQWLGPGLEAGAAGLMHWVGSKFMGGSGPNPAAPPPPRGRKRKKRPEQPDETAAEPEQPAANDDGEVIESEPFEEESQAQGVDERTPPTPGLLDFTKRFADFMTPQQNRTIVELLTKKEAGLLYDLLASEDEDEVCEIMQEIIGGGIKLPKLMELNSHLDPDQQRCLVFIRQLVAHRMQEQQGDDESEDDDDDVAE